ncbi:hypothetical protein LWH94_18305 [Marinobacter sp. G11]|uniref:hypothetical protein n=1 Tax=Marinobacter sp. G11 TaxID=2903522 RepID=UPI001E36C31C|nr:hypothetical protein [Marinobacter sp. G11]MCE0761132.1 hypothetical protein [Marinobacter sp. G11]
MNETTQPKIPDLPGRPRDEIEAVELVAKLGLAEVEKRYEALCTRAQERYDNFSKTGDIPVGFTALDYLTEEELSERHRLFLGMTICSDPQAEARQRILMRKAERQRLRKQKEVQYAA